MKVLVVVTMLVAVVEVRCSGLAAVVGALDQLVSVGCERNVSSDFKHNYHSFCANLFKLVSSHYKENFAISPYSVWLSFAALAEGLSGQAQEELLDVLKLPKEACLRLKYYDIATKLETSGDDVKFERKRYLVSGNGVELNQNWAREVRSAGLLDTASSAYNAYPEETKILLMQLISPTIVNKLGNLSRKSLIVDSLNYSALWATAFTEESIDRNAPFYNDAGEQIGTVEMYKIRRRVKLTHLPLLDLRVLELTVGAAGRYRLLLAMRPSRRPITDSLDLVFSSVVANVLSIVQSSLVPLDIAIPRFNVSFDISNVREILEELGAKGLFDDATLTQHISQPAAPLAAYVQRVALHMDHSGVERRLASNKAPGLLTGVTNLATGMASAVGREFIADRPFLYILLDSQTNSCHFMGVYSMPARL